MASRPEGSRASARISRNPIRRRIASTRGSPPISYRLSLRTAGLDILIGIYIIHIKMSSLRLEKTLHKLQERHDQLLKELINTPPMLRGSFSRVSTRCGKPTCWCAQSAKGHRHTRLTWSEQGKLFTRKVPEDHVDRVVELTRNHCRFRTCRRELARVQKQLLNAIAKLESAVNQQTRKPLNYLALTPKTAATTGTHRRKTSRKQESE